MAGKTIAEKILSAHSGVDAHAGDIVIANIDFAMSQDGTSALAIDAINSMVPKIHIEGEEDNQLVQGAINSFKLKSKVFDKDKVAMVMDHSCPSPLEGVSAIHAKMRKFGEENGITIYDWGCGVCHQLVPESGKIVPGDLVVGCDSHTCTYGALNVFSTGIGSTDGAAAMTTGKLWFKVPETIKVDFVGTLPDGVFSKDLILALARQIGADGATYKALEFGGNVIDELSIDARMTISNMAIEVGAKAGLMPCDEKTLAWFEGRTTRTPNPVAADPDAVYADHIVIDVTNLVPQVAAPHSVDNGHDVVDLMGMPIQEAYLGTCTNGRLEDFAIAAKILEGRKVHEGVRMIVAPASRDIYLAAMEAGYIQTFVKAGACIVTPGCGPCVGTHNGVPSNGERVISTANRNFKGRMGNSDAFIYLASPATVAATAVVGKLVDPRPYFINKEAN